MSCIQLPSAHIAAIVRFAVDYPHRPIVRGTPIRYRDGESWHLIAEDNAETIAGTLAQANANAYGERYRETPQPETVTARQLQHARRLSAVEAIKACHSYRYQSSDWGAYADSTAARIVEAIIDGATQIIPGYSDADVWVISDPSPKP